MHSLEHHKARSEASMRFPSEKSCFVCGSIKPLSDFYTHKFTSDGHLGKCKECTKAQAIERRRTSDASREYDRKRHHENPKRRRHVREQSTTWGRKNPEKRRAHLAVRRAIQKGILVRSACEVCGETKNVHGHHRDYARKLDVQWLCAKCHARETADERARAASGSRDASTDVGSVGPLSF